MRTEFIEHYPIAELKPADYNPRKLAPDKFEKLQESLRKFGVIKPVIVNGENGILTAGHQRTRAMTAIGMTHCPAIRIQGITRTDEIRFNLFHNSIETNKTPVTVDVLATKQKPGTYMFIPHTVVHFERNLNGAVVKSMGDLITRYGEWGSIVIDTLGNVLLNSDYAVASHQNRCGMICYMLPPGQEDEMKYYLGIEYGQYFYDMLGVKSYNQLHCQMHRLAGKRSKVIISTVYQKLVMPELLPSEHTIDFGAGRCAYARLMARKGYDIIPYEPHYQEGGKLNIQEVVRQIDIAARRLKTNGLFDVVVLDSVLNSVVNSRFEHAVMTTCNALLKDGGRLYLGTRNLKFTEQMLHMKTHSSDHRDLFFLDKDNFGATFRSGVWTMQHFHTPDSLRELLLQYFHEVKIHTFDKAAQIHATAYRPRKLDLDKVREAISTEFNMEYPGGYHHNRHEEIVSLLMNLYTTQRNNA